MHIGAIGRLIIKEFETATPWAYPFKQWLSQQDNGHNIHDADIAEILIDEFLAKNPEQYMPAQYHRINLRPLPVS